MKQLVFAKVSKEVLDKYLASVSELLARPEIQKMTRGKQPIYPTHILVGNTSGYLHMELVGVSSNFTPLEIRYVKPKTLDYLLGQSDEQDYGVKPSANNSLINLIFKLEENISDDFKKRIPERLFEYYMPAAIINLEPSSRFFSITKKTDYLLAEKVMLINNYKLNRRIRSIKLMIAVNNATAKSKYEDYIKNQFLTGKYLSNPRIIYFADGINAYQIETYAQFYNLFLQEGVHETTIGNYLNDHEDILLKAFGGLRLIHEQKLEWQVPGSQDREDFIQPDFLIERPDGLFDIIELKLPLLSRHSLTTGRYARRKFREEINSDLSQIVGYGEYFKEEKNRIYAEKTYGIKVKTPHLTLIVGNYENYDKDKVNQASRILGQDISIIDYDSVTNAYRLSDLKSNS